MDRFKKTRHFLQKVRDSASGKDIVAFEEAIKFNLPDDYKSFLLEFNGGKFKEDFQFTFAENGRITSDNLKILFGLSAKLEDHDSLQVHHQSYHVRRQRMLKDMFAIGETGSNLVCILLSHQEYGHIYYWDRDWEVDFSSLDTIAEAEEEGSVRRNCYFVAESFTKFIDKLVLSEEE